MSESAVVVGAGGISSAWFPALIQEQVEVRAVVDLRLEAAQTQVSRSGLDPVAVCAREFSPRGSWYRGAAAASCIFEMTAGVIFTYRGSWCAEGFSTSWNGDWRIVGERGTILYSQDQDPRAQVVAGDSGFNRPLAEMLVPISPIEATGQHGALREMLAFLRSGTQPQTEGHDNIRSLAMTFAATQSSSEARPLKIEW